MNKSMYRKQKLNEFKTHTFNVITPFAKQIIYFINKITNDLNVDRRNKSNESLKQSQSQTIFSSSSH